MGSFFIATTLTTFQGAGNYNTPFAKQFNFRYTQGGGVVV
jgi:hypothetical protein